MPTAPTVFISYSHKDKVWKDRLVKQLAVFQKQGLLKTWNDRRIGAGQEWLEEIQKGMADARVAVFLVSADSLTSDFILHTEIPHLLERREREGMTLFPVICTDCLWEEIPWLAKLQARPLNGRPLESFKGKLNSELTKIAKEILSIVRNGAPQAQLVNPLDIAKLTALAPLHQLPTPPADFTGREEDLEFLRSRLSEGGTGAILGLRGMGGVGKTTLALKLAEELKPRFPDAQIYLDLKGVGPQPLTAAQAMAHVIRSFHPEVRIPEGEPELAGLYRSVLDGKRVLLLMDNAARDKHQVESLIPPPTCLLLVTSRFRFALPGLVDRDLDEMPEKDARDLLLRIAPRIGDNTDEIAHLCGYLPLALRLAGSALAERPDLSPAEYIRLRWEGKEKLEPVEASLQTSYDLLTEERQRLWRLLSVFPDTFDAEAVAAVWNREKDEASADLGELVRCSLVDWEKSEERYRLHDLARAFAGEKITVAEQAEAQRRHAEYFLKFLLSANSLYEKGGQDSRLGLAFFDREWSNIRAGQAWAAIQFHDHEEAADLCSNYPNKGTVCLELRLHPRERIQWREIGLAAARYLGDQKAECYHLGNLGFAYVELGEPQRAIDFYEQLLAIARKINDKKSEGAALCSLGQAYVDCGETHRAIGFYEQTLTLTRETGDREREGYALGGLGNAYEDLGEAQRAIEFLEQGLTIFREIGDLRTEASFYGNLGVAYWTLGQNQRAIEMHNMQAIISRGMGDRRGEALASWNIGWALERGGDLASAADLMQVLVDYEREINHLNTEKDAAYVAALRARIADAGRD